jgi:hypothetical protein
VLGSSEWFFPLFLPTKIMSAPLLCLMHTTCSAYLILLDLITQIILGEEYRS